MLKTIFSGLTGYLALACLVLALAGAGLGYGWLTSARRVGALTSEVAAWKQAALVQTREADLARAAIRRHQATLAALRKASQARQKTLGDVIRSTEGARTWADTPVPQEVLDALR